MSEQPDISASPAIEADTTTSSTITTTTIEQQQVSPVVEEEKYTDWIDHASMCDDEEHCCYKDVCAQPLMEEKCIKRIDFGFQLHDTHPMCERLDIIRQHFILHHKWTEHTINQLNNRFVNLFSIQVEEEKVSEVIEILHKNWKWRDNNCEYTVDGSVRTDRLGFSHQYIYTKFRFTLYMEQLILNLLDSISHLIDENIQISNPFKYKLVMFSTLYKEKLESLPEEPWKWRDIMGLEARPDEKKLQISDTNIAYAPKLNRLLCWPYHLSQPHQPHRHNRTENSKLHIDKCMFMVDGKQYHVFKGCE